MTTLETEGSGIELNLGTISERELVVAKVLAVLLILKSLAVLLADGGRLDSPFVGDGGRVRRRGEELEEGLRLCH